MGLRDDGLGRRITGRDILRGSGTMVWVGGSRDVIFCGVQGRWFGSEDHGTVIFCGAQGRWFRLEDHGP